MIMHSSARNPPPARTLLPMWTDRRLDCPSLAPSPLDSPPLLSSCPMSCQSELLGPFML